MRRRFDVVSQRLAAQSHKLAIARLRVADAMSLDVVARIRKSVDDVISIVRKADSSNLQKTRERIADRLDDGMREAEDLFRAGLLELASESYDWSRLMLLRGIPRWYFRRVVATALVGEATEAPGIIPKIFRIAERLFDKYIAPALEVAAYAEPVAGAGRMTDAEWDQFGKEVLFPPLTRSQIETIIGDNHWRTTFPGNKSKFNDARFVDRLVSGIAAGEDVESLTRSIRDLEAGVYWKARRTARTESLRVAEMSQRETWDDLGDMIVGAQVLAVLDANTRPHHALRNGTVYAIDPDDGEKPYEELPILPDEPNCRCWSVPILAEPEQIASDPALTAVFANAGEENIPDPAAYDQWFAGADLTSRRMAVGVRRYAEMEKRLDRIPEWTDFIDPDTGKLLDRSSLDRESSDARAARKSRVSKVIRERERLLREVAAKGYISGIKR